MSHTRILSLNLTQASNLCEPRYPGLLEDEKRVTEHPWPKRSPRQQQGRLFSAPVYKIRDLLTMFAPTGTCARALRPCTRSPINAVRRGEGPFRRRRPSPRDPAEIFYSRGFLRADISTIDRPRRGCRHGPGRKRPTLRPRGPPPRGNHHHRAPTTLAARLIPRGLLRERSTRGSGVPVFASGV